MSNYQTPIKEIVFAATHCGDLAGIAELPGHGDATADLLEAIITEAGKFAQDVLDPLNRVGDEQGVSLTDGQAKTPDGWPKAYRQFIEGGWNGLPFSPDLGGQGLPWLVATAVQEIWHSANMAFSLCPMLTQAAIEAIQLHGSQALKETYLENLISGVWSGTMNLTEPQAGTDLAAIKTQAVPNGDHYLLSGQKIYITYGDHDLTENIIHLVLARLPDAPAGVKGISLFIVPGFLENENGEWSVRNDVETVSLEHKLGIHGCPTAVLAYGSGKYRAEKGAVGYLVGEEHQGMMYMFTMMNIARLAVGVESNGVAERAYQQAVWFARDRVQSTAIENPAGERVVIIEHPDVKRMLMQQKCRIESIRALGLVLGAALDKSLKHPDAKTRDLNQALVDILTPIVKGYGSEMGLENVSIALQVHGGMGYIEETGAAQYYRDQRITPIYEGTNGIQALDLTGRKLIRDDGRTARSVSSYIRRDLERMTRSELTDMRSELERGLDCLESAMDEILQMGQTDIRQAGGICEAYLRLWGTVACGWQSARAADIAMQIGDDSDPFYANKVATAKFYFAWEMPRLDAHRAAITKSARIIAEMNSAVFTVA